MNYVLFGSVLNAYGLSGSGRPSATSSNLRIQAKQPSNIKVDNVVLGEKKKKMHSFMSTLLSVLLEADGSEDEKTLSVIVAAAAAAAAAAVFCLAAFVHTSGTSAELTA